MSKCWYCNNELTTGDNPKHFGICNKCYDEMFKSGDTIIRSFTNKISDLEAKLADKNYDIKVLQKALELACETIKQMCGKPLWIGGNIPSPEPKDSKYFKDIAKEMLENE